MYNAPTFVGGNTFETKRCHSLEYTMGLYIYEE